MGGALEGKKEDVLHMVGHIIHMTFFFFFLQNRYGSCLDHFFFFFFLTGFHLTFSVNMKSIENWKGILIFPWGHIKFFELN